MECLPERSEDMNLIPIGIEAVEEAAIYQLISEDMPKQEVFVWARRRHTAIFAFVFQKLDEMLSAPNV